MNSYTNKVIFFFSLTFVIVLILAITSSYVFTNYSFGNNNVVVQNEKIKVSFNSESDSLENLYPLSYNEGLIKGNTIELNIENTKDKKIDYKIKAINNEENEITFDKIYYRINNGTPKLLSYDNGVLYNGELKAFGFEEISIKIWISSELIENSDQGKKSNLQIIVE